VPARLVELPHEAAGRTAVVGSRDRVVRRQLYSQVRNARGELIEQVYLLDESAERLGLSFEGLVRDVLDVVLVGQRLGVLVAEGVQTGEEHLRVRFVERSRLAHLFHGVRDCLLFVGAQVGVLGCRLGEHIVAPS
jgi:hypothetical protein